MTLRLAGIVQDSIVDGPGLRLAVFAQGCPHHCPGCHNPDTHPFQGGEEVPVARIAEMVRRNPLCAGVTLSGGEPFCQAEALAELAELAHALGKNVWTYTGYTYEELLAGLAENGGWEKLLQQTDVLVDGPFLLAQRSLDLPYRGSRNQRVLRRREDGGFEQG